MDWLVDRVGLWELLCVLLVGVPLHAAELQRLWGRVFDRPRGR